MLRNLKFALAVVPIMLLANCSTIGGLTQDQINALIQQIQAFTSQACSFRPQVQGVEELITALFPNAGPFTLIVNTVGNAICSAPITSAVRKRGTAVVTRVVQTPNGPIAVKGATYGKVR